MNHLKSINITGNIANGLTYKLCPSSEFSTGHWQVAVANICIDTSEDINVFCTISTNFSINKRYSDTQQIEAYEQPLNSLHFNLKKANPRAMNRFTHLLWLDINRISDDMDFHFVDPLSGQRLQQNAKISMNVLFRRLE